MVAPWRQWCRLCAQTSSPIGIFSKNEHDCNLAELILKYTHLRVDPLDDFPLTICTTCYQFVMSVAKFADQASRVDRMYASLACNDMNSSDPSCIKLQFGVVKEEPANCYNKCDQSTDTLDLYFECEEEKFDPLAAQDDEKEGLELDVTINELPDIPIDDSDDNDDSFANSDECAYESKELQKEVSFKTRNNLPKILKMDCFTTSNKDAGESKNSLTKPPLVLADKAKTTNKEPTKRKRKTQSFPCDTCDQSFPQRRTLRFHKKTAHAPAGPKELLCDKKFITRKGLKEHQIHHIEPDKRELFPCTQCEKVFQGRGNLAQHLRKVHLDRPFMCELCGKSFITNRLLKEHKYTHMDETPFKCLTCNKQFTTHSGLKKHEDTHSGTAYTCTTCGLVLNTKRTLQRHMIVHSDQKNYKCTICNSEFKRSKTLKIHLIGHTGMRPYSCPFCDMTFVNAPSCRGHKKRVHPVELAALEGAGIASQYVKLPELKQLNNAKLV